MIKMKKLVRVQCKKHENVLVFSGQFTRDYDTSYDHLIDMAQEDITDAVNDYMDQFEIDQPEAWESEEMQKAEMFFPGHYTFDCGDYSYHITIIEVYEDHPIIEYGDIIYLLNQEPYLDTDGSYENPVYKANATDITENEYRILWECHDDWETIEDGHDMCDWEEPTEIQKGYF